MKPAALGLLSFLFVLEVDLLSKLVATRHLDVLYNDANHGDFTRRVVLSALAVGAVWAFGRIARWRGFGRLRGAWIGVGVLVGGITGNGLSHVIWPHGTPDFIDAGDYVWNVADFAIGLGLAGCALSIAASALLAYARGRFGTRPGV